MSVMSSSETYMAHAMRSGSEERESFQKFFECWLVEQNQDLQELVSASKDHPDNGRSTTESTREEEQVFRPLLDRVIDHYDQYYRAKSRWVKQDVLAMLSPSWRSTLEDAFLWIGGWRPSMAFHLLYSKSGLQLETRLAELIRGLSTRDLGDLSPSQLSRVDELQRKTIKEEQTITEKFAKQQETVADASMVELSHVVSEMLRNREEVTQEEDGRVDSALGPKEEGLEGVLHKADDLRLRTLKEVLNILNPIQAVHFLIAASELHLRLHDWGRKRDARHVDETHQSH